MYKIWAVHRLTSRTSIPRFLSSALSVRLFSKASIEGKMGAGSAEAHKKAIGDELLAVLPSDGRPWYTKGHLLKLNFCILSLVLFCGFQNSKSGP